MSRLIIALVCGIAFSSVCAPATVWAQDREDPGVYDHCPEAEELAALAAEEGVTHWQICESDLSACFTAIIPLNLYEQKDCEVLVGIDDEAVVYFQSIED